MLCPAIYNQINRMIISVQKMMDNTVAVDDFLDLLLNDLGFGEERDGELENNSQDFQ